jgi:hypothetical protein
MVLELSEREQAIFEGGIKLGALFHQFVGTPVSVRSRGSLETAIEEAVLNQPFVEDVKVKIGGGFFDDIESEFDYLSLTGDMLDVEVVVKAGEVRCTCRLEYKEDLKYPLMYVESIES